MYPLIREKSLGRPYLRCIDAIEVTRSLKGGVATLGALAARTGQERELLLWALEDALARGWIAASGPGCGDGICSTTAPAVYTLTDAGRAALDEAAAV